MRRKLWLALALSPVLMASTCIERVHVGVEPGPRPDDGPSFRFAHDGDALTYVEEFQVARCLERRAPTWRIVRDGQTPNDVEPLRITYGQVPRGYRETTPPQPLQAGGCYHAIVESLAPVGSRTGNMGGLESFRLLPNRQVITGGPAGPLFDSRPFRQLNRAAVACTRGYRRADTAADSAAVDAREFHVLDARVSCGWLFAEWPDVARDPASTERVGLGLIALLATYIGAGLLLEQIPDVPQ